MNMKLLAVVIPLSIYHGCSTWKIFREEIFTLDEFTPVNMKFCGRQNVRKHREIKYSDNYITLYISLKFGSLEKMRVTSSDPKDYLGISGKGLINSLGFNTNVRSKKKSKYAITNVSMKYLSKIIKEFENYLIRVMCRRGPNMNQTTVNFT